MEDNRESTRMSRQRTILTGAGCALSLANCGEPEKRKHKVANIKKEKMEITSKSVDAYDLMRNTLTANSPRTANRAVVQSESPTGFFFAIFELKILN